MTVLAGDVGGTKTVLALVEPHDGALTVARLGTFPSHEFPTFESVVARFCADGPKVKIAAACFGVAGPVMDGRVKTTNLPWQLDEERLAAAIPARRVRLLNDLAAMGEGMLALPPSSFLELQSGESRSGTMALIAAGTGLGEAILHWDGTRHAVMGSEGGHVDFAPRTDLEVELLRFLRNEFGHVSYERLVSGPGLHNIYRFLRSRDGASEPAWLRDRLESGDPSAAISETALRGEDPLCVEALDMFVSIYGAEAGNLALKSLAVGGVLIGGGIGPKIRSKLADGTFQRAFCGKGRFAPLLSSIPVRMALEPQAPLLGAAKVAASL
ncbi:MAG TPA: glucokinase [Myxococcales bacterium]|nr:glucokinase [Myxococcales bacterium]